MASQIEARNALLAAFKSGFEGLTAGRNIPYTWDNRTLDGSGHRHWVEVAVRQTGSEQRTLGKPGNRIFRREGVLEATIHSKAGAGMAEGMEIAEGIRKIFEGKRIEGVNPIGGVLVQEEGRDITGFRIVVSFPHWYEERG